MLPFSDGKHNVYGPDTLEVMCAAYDTAVQLLPANLQENVTGLALESQPHATVRIKAKETTMNNEHLPISRRRLLAGTSAVAAACHRRQWSPRNCRA